MRAYETIVINKTSVDESTYKNYISRVEETVKNHGGKVLVNDKWGNRRMAYPIKKETSGCYTYIAYSGDNKVVQEIERQFRNLDYVLRYLSVQVSDGEGFDAEAFKANYTTQNWNSKSNLSEGTHKPYNSEGHKPYNKEGYKPRDRDSEDKDE